MNRLRLKLVKRESGVTTVETALILPWLFIIIFGITELTLYLYSRNVVHYAAYMAARSYIVLGERSLESIDHTYGSTLYRSKSVAEVTAERIIFESLPWENKRITSHDDVNPVSRSYFDTRGAGGAVSVELSKSGGFGRAKVTYCMPIHFNLYKYFLHSDLQHQCSNVTSSDGSGTYSGIPIIHEEELTENL